jgi:hypothetical protein
VEQHYETFVEATRFADSYLHGTAPIPSADPLRRYRFAFRLWRDPSFGLPRSWSVFHDDTAWLVRRMTWDRPSDYARIIADPLRGLREGFHPQPTIEVRDRPLAPDAVAAHLSAGRAISIPVVSVPHGITILDGETRGYEDDRVRLAWSAVPEPWKALDAWVRETMAWLEQACDVARPGG